MVVGIVDKLLHGVLLLEILGQGEHLAEILHLLTVVVGVVESKLKDQTAHSRLLVIRGHPGCIFGHEDIGRDAASAIHYATVARVVGLASVFDAVLREELAVLIARNEILLVAGVLAVGVGLLDTTARRREVTGNGQADHAAVGERNLLLDEALSERAPANNRGPVIVLHGSGENLRRRSRPLVDEHYQRDVLVGATAVGAILLAWRLASLGVDDQFLVGQKLIGHLNRTLQIATRIVTEVYDQVGEALLLKVGQGDEQLGISLLAKVLHLDVACVIIEHIGGSDGLGGYLAARHLIGKRLGVSVAQHAELDLGALRTLQTAHGLLIGHLRAHKFLPVDIDNLVASQDACPLGRSVLDDVLHIDGVLTDGELDAYTRERAAQVIVCRLHILRTDIDGVRIELSQDLRNGLLHQRIDVDLVHILVVDDAQQVVQATAAIIDDRQSVARKMVGIERAYYDAQHHADSHQQRHEPVFLVVFHFPIPYLLLSDGSISR